MSTKWGTWNLKLAIILVAEYGIFAHVPGTVNIEADKQSRILEDATEWKLYPAVFQN